MSRRHRNQPRGGLFAAARKLHSRLLRVDDGSVALLVAFSAVSIIGLSAMRST
jgi:hypothetical protein